MKTSTNYVNISSFFFFLTVLFCFSALQNTSAQGFNNNQWIFGYCGPGQENSYLSFGRGEDPVVRTLSSDVIVGKSNVAVAIDPITGYVIFYTNGELIYDGDNEPMEGMAPGIEGDFEGSQKVAIGSLVYEPNGEKLFYIFYISSTGRLQYALIDMNAPGQALPNQPPLGQVIQKNVLIANGASGALALIKTPQSPSYLISFEGGKLLSRRIESSQGQFSITSEINNFPFTPKAIVFEESTGKLILIPENAGDDIAVVDFDASTGSFGSISTVSQSGGSDAIEGGAISPDGQFLYFSRGNQLLRVPINDLDAEPEVMPIEGTVDRIFDVKVGPDGRLYYIYEETEDGPQLIGRVNNPNESDLDELDIEEDPFNGTDFCGRVFPQFAPNQDIEAEVDFAWEPIEPCSNNPIQLTSLITPENYRPVSFEWTITPPLTDEDGEPLEINLNQEHLLLPEEATGNQSIQVTLTVTFADGTTRTTDTKEIQFLENELQANFTPQDTTICSPNCINLTPLLQVQQGNQQGGQAPGGSGGGQAGNYEYFWSNKGEWGPEAPNEVCRPGLYWVLVREPNSSCYAYAEIRVRIWDLPDQSNNIWYFGDGAGLDFNPDPDDPSAPVPRPVSHNQNIPAGTTTISDGTGQVLFFTDGETVWDLNGEVMNNGQDIGGDKDASEGVIGVPVPQNPTIFYVFTTQRAADGSNRVSYSVVDIKSENSTGVGSVVSKNNFLFSPSTEHSAALASGDTTWVLFHELGNNTFRAYPVSQFGIGQPVFSSVGSSHGFNSGVGSMKFSPDGSQVAVTIQDGNCSKLEIFDFDQSTGKLTEYALLDLGCGDEIYGLEFSNDGTRVFVSYTGSSGKIEEYLIKRPESAVQGDGIDTNLSCFDCFNSASTSAQRESCILATRNVLTTDGPFGALQVGPDGQIYVSRPGADEITTISSGVNCTQQSFYSEQGIPLVPGTSMNLGLPAFVQQSGSSIPEPALSGPETICLDPEFGALALFEGAGEPDIDSYFWTIVHEDGEVIITDLGGPGEEFQNLEQALPRPGIYTVSLRVDRCGDPEYFREEIIVEVVAVPEITLPDEFTLCVGNPVQLTAINGYDPSEGLYDFEWRNAAGQRFGDENSNTIEVTEESIYTVTVSFRLPEGLTAEEFDVCPASKSVFVGPAFDFDLSQSVEEVCFDESLVIFAPNTPLSGEWFYRLAGAPTRVSLGIAFELELIPSTLPSPGEYEIIFLAEDPLVEGCFVEKITPLMIFPLPSVEVLIISESDDCVNPNGSFAITALTAIQSLEVRELGLPSFGPLAEGESLPPFDDLEPGLYTLVMTNQFGCEFVQSVTILNSNPPQGIEGYEVTPVSEACDAQGVQEGQIVIRFVSGPVNGSYQIIRQGDGSVIFGPFSNAEEVIVNAPAGIYAINIEDENGCSVPFDQLVEIEQIDFVDFSAPTTVEACGSFTFSPTSADQLVFSVRNTSGNIIPANQDGSFTFAEAGNYFILGEDPSGIDCPLEREINVVITTPPNFSLTGPRVDCELGVYYEAVLGPNEDPNQVFIFWFDSNRQIVSRNPLFFPRSTGQYFLQVQPRSGSPCQLDPIEFNIESLLPEIKVELDVLPYCTDQTFTTIEVLNNLIGIAAVEWYKINNGQRELINNPDGPNLLIVEENGIYEVELVSVDGCVLGSEQVEITQSTIVAPVINEQFLICALEGVSFEIDPGIYTNYSWLLDGDEISTAPTFTPVLPGQYELIVSDDQGCSFEVRFEVLENCEIDVRIPNALVLDDVERNFRVFPTRFVDELEVFIYNRWGELIFYCQNSNINGDAELCSWDGVVNGRFVPIGTYPVVVNYKSLRQNLNKSLKSAIIVIK